MTDYGTILNPNLAPEKLAIYNLFNSYFSDPILTKIKNENGGSMYAAKQNLLMRDYRHLIVITPEDNQLVGSTFNLSQLDWVYLQTRSFDQELECGSFTYISSGKSPYDSRLTLVEKNDRMARYSSKDYPQLTMCLLSKNKDNFGSFPQLGTIAGALETFRTIFKIEI